MFATPVEQVPSSRFAVATVSDGDAASWPRRVESRSPDPMAAALATTRTVLEQAAASSR